MRRIGGCT